MLTLSRGQQWKIIDTTTGPSKLRFNANLWGEVMISFLTEVRSSPLAFFLSEKSEELQGEEWSFTRILPMGMNPASTCWGWMDHFLGPPTSINLQPSPKTFGLEMPNVSVNLPSCRSLLSILKLWPGWASVLGKRNAARQCISKAFKISHTSNPFSKTLKPQVPGPCRESTTLPSRIG